MEKIRLYADDILLYHRITSLEDCTLLKNDRQSDKMVQNLAASLQL